MNYFEAIKKSAGGKAIISVASGRVIRPSELGQIWVGEHWVSHNTLDLTKSEIGGAWSVSDDNKEEL